MTPGQGSPETEDLLQRILLAAATYPGRPALSGHRNRTLRYRDLAVAIVATAKNLRRNGFQPGERLLSTLPAAQGTVILVLGTVAAGGSVIIIDPESAPDAFAEKAALAGPAWVAAESVDYATRLVGRLTRRRGLPTREVLTAGTRTLRTGPWLPGVPAGTIPVRSLRSGRGSTDDEPLAGLRGDPAAEAAVMFTPDGTEVGRAVLHTRGSLAAGMSLLALRSDIGHRTRVYTDQLLLGLPALAAGAHWRLPPPRVAPTADPARYAKNIGRATHLFLGAADLVAVLTAISERLAPRPTALQQILLTTASLTPALVARTRTVLPRVELLAIYGAVEIRPISVADGTAIASTDPEGDVVGELLPGVEGRIASDGELIISGPNLASRYLGEPPMDEYATGDLALLRDRTVVLTGRKNDVIVRNRMAIRPGHHEATIESIPGVGHATLIGVPNDIGDERIVLVLQPAGQPVNDHPLAGEPKQSNTRDDDLADAQEISVLLHHPLASSVAAALPGAIGGDWRPDQIVVLSAIPTSGPQGRPDRVALRRLLVDLPIEDSLDSS